MLRYALAMYVSRHMSSQMDHGARMCVLTVLLHSLDSRSLHRGASVIVRFGKPEPPCVRDANFSAEDQC